MADRLGTGEAPTTAPFGARQSGRRVAVTGLGAISSVGIGVDALWESLTRARSGVAPIKTYDASDHPVRIAGEVGDFEPREWLSEKNAKRLDRFCHFAVAAAAMAVADSRLEPRRPDRVATIVGSAIGGIHAIADAVDRHAANGPYGVPVMFVPSAIPNMAAAQVAMRFGFGGPSTCPATACASSADAVGMGFRLIRDGYADACVAGGAEACIRPEVIAGFANIRALSRRNEDPAGAARPFSADRDGFALSEGAAALVLEPVDVAHARGARVYAEICAYGQSSDAFHETAPDPNGDGLARAIDCALTEGGLSPSEIGYVNAHGTGTARSDPIETRALRRALGDGITETAVSSTKSMTGHLLGAAGALEAVATVLSLARGKLPPTINLSEPDDECDLDYVPNRARSAEVEAALSESMGFGGHNVVLAFRRNGAERPSRSGEEISR